LKITPPAVQFTWALQLGSADTVRELASTHYLQFDAYWVSEQWQPDDGTDGWVRWDKISLNAAPGWGETADANITDPANPSYPGSWDPNNWGATHQRTLTYDATAYDESGVTDWGQLNFSFNFGNTETMGSFYIDNIQTVLIPEPGSLALLGLGALLVSLRRRRG
jgi:hypothetical protein